MKPCFDLLIDIKPHTQTNTRKKRQSRMRKTKPQANMINKFVVFWQTHMSWYLLWLILRQQSKLSSDWSYAHFPFKWPRQEAKTKHKQNKTTFTATRSQKCSPTNCCFFVFFLAHCHRDFVLLAILHCLLFVLAFDWLRPAVLFFLNWTVILFAYL